MRSVIDQLINGSLNFQLEESRMASKGIRGKLRQLRRHRSALSEPAEGPLQNAHCHHPNCASVCPSQNTSEQSLGLT